MPDRIEVRAVRNGGVDHIEVPTADEALVAALLRERAGYVTRSRPDRVAAVDAELNRLGVDASALPTTPVKGAPSDDRKGHRSRQPAGRRGAAERR
ncbi:hypothetical protein [Micromonospora zamorensis]|uniref:hypothetical protein n=1 Tax=Micromonospora zamorensis TaxID=709883 RepID=UPI00379F5AAB